MITSSKTIYLRSHPQQKKKKKEFLTLLYDSIRRKRINASLSKVIWYSSQVRHYASDMIQLHNYTTFKSGVKVIP